MPESKPVTEMVSRSPGLQTQTHSARVGVSLAPKATVHIADIECGVAAEDTDFPEHPFEFNMVMVERGVMHCFPTEELECGPSDCPYVVPSDIPCDERVLTEGVICESELDDSCLRKDYMPRRWLLDSGASSHYVKEMSRFRAYKWLTRPIRINTGKGPIWGVARGEVVVVMAIGRVVIGDVLLVPDLNVDSDLLSVTALMRAGFGVNFQSGRATIHKEGKTRGTASPVARGHDDGHSIDTDCRAPPPDGGLCYLEEFDLLEDFAMAMQCVDTQPIEVWHRRLGHLHPRAVRKLTSLVIGIRIGDPQSVGQRNIDCVDCLKGTQHQIISRFPFTKTTRPLERVSADICGPMPTPDCTWNYKYLLVFVDHYSRYTWIFPLLTKDMAIRATQVWKANAENTSGSRLLTLQTDNAGEFMGKKWTKMCQDFGITHFTSAPYGPSMNSYAERVLRTVVGHASSMLWTAGVQVEFWALAAKASVYLLNRSPHSGIEDSTPYEMWHKIKPHVGYIRTWGCRAWAAIPKERRKKFDTRSRECILVGFYDTENLYQLWDVNAKELIKRRDVIFHEHVLGHPAIARAPSPPESQLDILGQSVLPEVEIDHNDDLEELYPVIEELKCDEWEGVPEWYLPMQDELVYADVPKTFAQAMASSDAINWTAAIESEHESLRRNQVYKWVALPGVRTEVRILPCKWLFVIKRKLDGTVDRFKARIVAGGHRQREGIDFKETFAPVAKFASLRVLLTLAALEDLDGEQVDIVTAFLYGELDETVYMRVPDGLSPLAGDEYLDHDGILRPFDVSSTPKLVWLLCRSLYGLRQSPRCFYRKLDDLLVSKGYVRVPADYGVWVLHREVVLLVHVDDMQVFGNRSAINTLIEVLESVFVVKRLGPTGNELFLGLRLERDRSARRIAVSQSHYARQILVRFGMTGCTPVHTPMDPREDWTPQENDKLLDSDGKRQYQAAIGSLIYLMLGTRPDLGFCVNKLAQYCGAPTDRHWRGIMRILRFVRGTTSAKLVLGNVPRTPDETIPADVVCGYFDSAFMDNTHDRHSTMGYAFYCAGSLVSWSSRKQRTIALSTTEAEYLAGTEATKEVVWLQQLMRALGVTSGIYPTTLYGDNQGANALARNPEYHGRTKHIHGRQRFITEMVEQGIIRVLYIPTCNMVADALTKALPRDRYWRCMKLFGIHVVWEDSTILV